MTEITIVEVIEVEMNLVGGISDEEDLDELETITKVFVIAHRMRSLPYERNTKKNPKRRYGRSPKKISLLDSNAYRSLPVFTVRGLN
jgi:hypothetical protein